MTGTGIRSPQLRFGLSLSKPCRNGGGGVVVQKSGQLRPPLQRDSLFFASGPPLTSELGEPNDTRTLGTALSSDPMTADFYRIRRLPPYVFAEVNAMKAAARARGEDIVDLGMGNPDGAPAPHVIAKLAEVAASPTAHRYSASRGIPGLRRAQADYYERRFGVGLDPETEVVVTLGSKEGLANLAQAITAPGDVVLAPNPSYPIHTFGFTIAGAAIRSIPAAPGPDFFQRLEKSLSYSVPRPSACWSWATPPIRPRTSADLAFYEEVVRFARANKLWVISDLAYAEIYFGDHAHAVNPAGGRRQGRGGGVHEPCPRPTPWPAGGWASRSATGSSSRP